MTGFADLRLATRPTHLDKAMYALPGVIDYVAGEVFGGSLGGLAEDGTETSLERLALRSLVFAFKCILKKHNAVICQAKVKKYSDKRNIV